MAKQLAVAVDVGGTTIDAVGISADGKRIGKVGECGSPSAGTAKEIVDCLAGVIGAVQRQVGNYEISVCGIAMPAPFDYKAGVSRMTHKFQAIYGLNLGELLQEKTGLSIRFVNDADAFGLGVGWRQLPGTHRFVALTIGTGLGGCFIENGISVVNDERVPSGGEIWDLPYQEGIFEDYVSARGVAGLYSKLGIGKGKSAKVMATQARSGDEQAIRAYQAMGTALGEGLAPILARFIPEKIVVGGKVGLSLDLFEPALSRALLEAELPPIPVLQATRGNLALWGAARHALLHAAD